MKTINYYFIKEFQWKSNWFSEIGLLKACVYPTDEFILKFGFLDLSIFNSIFVSDMKLKDIRYVDNLISNIKKVINGEIEITGTHCETEVLEIKKDFSRPIDMLDMHGSGPFIDGPNSWNITTPLELQYIPTPEILQLFIDWRQFLLEQESVVLLGKT